MPHTAPSRGEARVAAESDHVQWRDAVVGTHVVTAVIAASLPALLASVVAATGEDSHSELTVLPE